MASDGFKSLPPAGQLPPGPLGRQLDGVPRTQAQQRVDEMSALIKAPQDFAGGLFLIVLAGIGFLASFGYLGNSPLKFGTLSEIGPGLFPRAVAVMVAALGALLMFNSTLGRGPVLTGWNLRGLGYVLCAILFFAIFIRGMTLFGLKIPALGMLGTVPIVVVLASQADPETKLKEIIPFALLMTVLCVGLFRYALRLSLPVAPWLIGY